MPKRDRESKPRRFLSKISHRFSSSPSSPFYAPQSAAHAVQLADADRQSIGSEPNVTPELSSELARSSSSIPGLEQPAGFTLSPKAKTALQGVRVFLKVLEQAADAFPPLKATVGVINAVIHVYENVSGDREEVESLLEQLEELSQLLAKRAEYAAWPDINDSEKMYRALDQATMTLKGISSQGRMAHYANSYKYTDNIRKCYKDINAALRQFQLELGIQQERMTLDILKETVLVQLERSKDAPYTSAGGGNVERQGCTPGTRLHILQQILDWATTSHPAPSLFWMYGLAGIGKTAIALTLCERLRERGLLASSYFCSIQLDSSNSKYIIPTVARHLASMSRAFAVELVSQLQADPDIAQSTLRFQLDGLLCTPWKLSAKARATLPPRSMVVVIDALDECDRGVDFLTHLLDVVGRGELQGIRFLVTSRPVPKLVEKWQSKRAQGHQIALHDVDRDRVDDDIRLYLQTRLGGLKASDVDINSLVSASGGLFIFASTAVKYILPSEPDLTPVEQLERFQSILSQDPGTIQGINDLYSRIVNVALPQEEHPTQNQKKELQRRLSILHTIISLAEPQTVEVVAALVGADAAIVRSVVSTLHSVLYTATDGRIHIFHASFYDFIVVQERCFSYHCDVPLTNYSLANNCLQTMNDCLRFNICRLESSFIPDNELDPPLQQRLTKYVGPLLAYTCQHWWGHWKKCNESGHCRLSPLLRSLLQKNGMHWIESMSLLGHLQACKSILEECASQPEVDQSMPDIPPLAKIAAQLVSMFISIPPPRITSHLYLSLLATWMETPVIEDWKSQLLHVPRVLQRQLDGRQYCRMTLNVESPVICVAFLLDCNRVATGSGDETIRLWDVEAAEETHCFRGHTGSLWSVAFSPDGKRVVVVSKSRDETMDLWDVEAAKEIHCFQGHKGSVRSVAFSPDGKRMVSGSRDETILLWDVEAAKDIHRFEGHTGSVLSVAFDSDGRRVVSGSSDRKIRLWDIMEATEISCFDGHTGWVLSVVFSPDGKQVVSGSSDRNIRLWDVEAAKETHCFQGHTGSVMAVTFSPDGKRVISGSEDTTVRLWDLESSQEIHCFEGHTGWVQSIAFLPDGKRVITGSRDETIRLWDVESAEESHRYDGHKGLLGSAAFTLRERIHTESESRKIGLVNVELAKAVHRFYGHTGSIRSVAFSPDGKQAVSGSSDQTICIWDVEAAKGVYRLEGHTGWVLSVAFSHDGKRVVSGSSDRKIRLWDLAEVTESLRLVGNTGWVVSVAFSPDDKRVVSGSSDRKIRLWDIEAAKETHCFQGHTGSVLSVIISPDGKRVISGSEDTTARLWDIESAKEVHCFEGHTGWVQSIAFSPDAKLVVTGSRDETIRLWDVESAKELLRFHAYTGWVQSVIFSPDGKRILSVSAHTTAHVWDVERAKETDRVDGHTAWVQSFSFFPGSQRTSADTAMPLWDGESIKNINRLKALTGRVESAAFSPDGKRVVSGLRDPALLICDIELDNVTEYFPFSTVAFLNRPSASFLPPNLLWLQCSGLSYFMRDDGWVITSRKRTGKEEKLFWLPPSLRPFYPPVLDVFSQKGFNKIDLTDCIFGVGWDRCYVGSDEVG